MKNEKIQIATVVYYDGKNAYTTHRALFITDSYKMTAKSKKALNDDFYSAGIEVLKIDFNCQLFENVFDFMENLEVNSIYEGTEKDIDYIRNKFLEYFIG